MQESLVGRVLDAAMGCGGSYADIFAEDTLIHSLELQDGKVSQTRQVCLHGAGVRVLKGGATGYAYTMDLRRKALIDAARFAATIGGKEPLSAMPGIDGVDDELLLPCAQPAVSPGHVRELLLQADQMAHDMDARVVRVKAAVATNSRQLFFANTEGVSYTDYRPFTSIVVRVVMDQDSQSQMGYSTRQMQLEPSFVTDEVIRQVVREAVDRTSILFEAVRPEGGEMPVVMAAGASGIFIHEAIGHAFEADFNRLGTSIFSGRLGERICGPDISIVDDGSLAGDAGFLRWDDEGVCNPRTLLVDRGVLNSYMHDRISAAYYGVSPTGNGRRESFRFPPQPRMRCTYMLAGEVPPADIIRSVKKGIYAQTFTNGQVQIGAGDFTFYMKQGYLIEDGKLTRPVRDVNIIGNGPQALGDIGLVGNDLKIDHSAGMCGKGGQSVLVSQGLPTVLVNRLVVG